MIRFLQYVVNGIAGGFVIGLLALSLVMIYRSTRVLSFAQGVIASLATYVYYQMQTVWNWSPLIALPLALIAAALIGAIADLTAMRPLRKADALTRTVATLGIVLVLQVVMRVGWGGQESFVRPLVTGRVGGSEFGVGAQQLLTAAVAIVAAIVFGVWTRASYRGLGLQAIAEDSSAARLLGVDPTRASLLAWSIGGVLAGLSGILVTPTLVLNPLQMTLIMVTAFGAALLGGFTSLPLALGGGLLIGVVQEVATGYVRASGVTDAIGFIAAFAVLVLMRGKRGAVVLPGRSAA